MDHHDPTAGSALTMSAPPAQHVTQGAGRYLLELYWLSRDTDDRIGMGRTGDHLGVSSASVTEMVSRLAEDGVVDYREQHGVVLTDRGVAIGEALAWRYCVVDNFFRDVLDTSLDPSTAYEFGYRLPEGGVVTLGEKLGMPCTRACRGTPQCYAGCQLRSKDESQLGSLAADPGGTRANDAP